MRAERKVSDGQQRWTESNRSGADAGADDTGSIRLRCAGGGVAMSGILDWLFNIIDTDWIQTDLRDMPLSDSEYWQIRSHDAEASGAQVDDDVPIGKQVK